MNGITTDEPLACGQCEDLIDQQVPLVDSLCPRCNARYRTAEPIGDQVPVTELFPDTADATAERASCEMPREALRCQKWLEERGCDGYADLISQFSEIWEATYVNDRGVLTVDAVDRFELLAKQFDLYDSFGNLQTEVVRRHVPAWLTTWAELAAKRELRKRVGKTSVWEDTEIRIDARGVWGEVRLTIGNSRYGAALLAALQEDEQMTLAGRL